MRAIASDCRTWQSEAHSLCVGKSQFTEAEHLKLKIGHNIKKLRVMNGMTQRELAWRLQVSTQAVSKWERGYAYPDLTMLLPLAELFSVTIDELFGREDKTAAE